MAYSNFGNSIQRNSPVVFNLILINVLVFAAQNLLHSFDVTGWGSLYYFKSPLFKPHQLVTHMFMHVNLAHIFFNMFGLWMFGSILERFWGPKRFLVFYLVCGIGSAIFEQFLSPYDALQVAKNSEEFLLQGMPLDQLRDYILNNNYSLGASGAIMGVFAAFAMLFPNTELYIMFIPIPVKAKYVIPFFVLIDLFGGIYRIKGDEIGHFAHLGGALVGFLLVLYWNKTNKKTLY
jgi:membrane associated rhomboid family serine protease